jgi:putative ABC transport system ATP-binding protein
MESPVLQFEQVDLTYPADGGRDRPVLHQVDFSLASGRAVSLVGRSGSGKSTLLHLSAGIMVPTRGRVLLNGRDLGALNETHRTLQRRASVGQVFQFFHLLPHLSVAENIGLPGWIAGQSGSSTRTRTAELLQRVGLADRANDPVGQLSGGEMQRIAICRALFRRPALVLADEPTGSLDESTGLMVMDLLLDLVRDERAALLYVTHSRDLARKADTAWRLTDGRLETGSAVGDPT